MEENLQAFSPKLEFQFRVMEELSIAQKKNSEVVGRLSQNSKYNEKNIKFLKGGLAEKTCVLYERLYPKLEYRKSKDYTKKLDKLSTYFFGPLNPGMLSLAEIQECLRLLTKFAEDMGYTKSEYSKPETMSEGIAREAVD
jgi:hypothetical protein